MSHRYTGRHRAARRLTSTAVTRPALIAAAAAAVTFGGISPASAEDVTVRPGDTLSKLAASHGTTWRSIYEDNRSVIGGNPNVLRVGQVLDIGGGSGRSSAPSGGGSYVVRSGDTLSKIAARHGTTWQRLHALNRQTIGSNPNVLRVGQRLSVSGSAASAPSRPSAPERTSRSSERAAPATAPAGSFQDYALRKLGGDRSQFNCLVALWGKESGWNPNAQNPRSTAYGIAQFLDSTWAGTGIAKTSDGYRQIDAGLIYINNRHGSPCGAWSHFQSRNWY
jgi:LysM repeat protein